MTGNPYLFNNRFVVIDKFIILCYNTFEVKGRKNLTKIRKIKENCL